MTGGNAWRSFNSLRFNTTFRLHQKINNVRWYRAWHKFKYANLVHFSVVLFFVGFLSYTSIAPQLVDRGVQGKIENKLPAAIPTEVSWDEYHASRSRMKD
ncbi:hypothetical protein K0A96_02925, partial [Patescibacteria group bacterium]|nr:hypothetical protein [Patescibacteria group bacterium]